MPMRKLMALVVLLCGAASANAAERWCSGETELLIQAGGPVVKTNGKITEALDPEFWPEHVTFATIDYASEGEEHKGEKIAIYKDRVFWPCP